MVFFRNISQRKQHRLAITRWREQWMAIEDIWTVGSASAIIKKNSANGRSHRQYPRFPTMRLPIILLSNAAPGMIAVGS
jgi:hypothetical protein